MNYKRVLTVMVCLGLMLAVAGLAVAKDVKLSGPITAVVEAADKNGNTYVRAIVTEAREKDGIKYNAGVPVMFFGEHVDAGKQLQAGDTLSCIATVRWFNGRKSYTYLAPVAP